LIQFELLQPGAEGPLYVTCTNAQFDALCEEQTGLNGTARVNAAIDQLLREACEEIDKPNDLRRKGSTDSFGNDDEPQAREAGQSTQTDLKWAIRSQQAWQFGEEQCTLTILENVRDNMLQFELLRLASNTTLYVMCTNEQFDGLCSEQSGLAGVAVTNAAIAQLFREAMQEVAKG